MQGQTWVSGKPNFTRLAVAVQIANLCAAGIRSLKIRDLAGNGENHDGTHDRFRCETLYCSRQLAT
jgi:hypothetical protein